MATGTVFLRPIADVFVEHEIIPSSLGAAYLAINEEVCDGKATYIRVYKSEMSSNKLEVEGTSRFEMGIVNSKFKKITSIFDANVVIYPEYISTGTPFIVSTIYINGTQFSSESIYVKAGNKTGYAETKIPFTDEEIDTINSYFKATGNIPVIEIELLLHGEQENDNSKTTSMMASCSVSQMYIEFECEGIPLISKKINSQWFPCKKALRKSNGVWTKIGLDEAEVLLDYNMVIDKCKCSGHIEKAIADISATCTETGMTGGIYCKFCGTTLKEHDIVLDALGHNETKLSDVAATCETTGMTGGIKCSRCGITLKEHDTVIPELGHKEAAVQGTATCTEDGMTGGIKCSRCGITLKEHDTVQPALGHNEMALPGTATCTEDGMTGGIKCSRCGITLKEHDAVQPAFGHTFNTYTGSCTRSGCSGYHPDSFTFTIHRDTQPSPAIYRTMSGLTWSEWAKQSIGNIFGGWNITSDGFVRYDYSFITSTNFQVDGVTGSDLIIAGKAYTATDGAAS